MEKWQIFAATITAILTAAGTFLKIFLAKGGNDGGTIRIQENSQEAAALRERVAALEERLRNVGQNIEALKHYTEDETSKIWREVGNIDGALTDFIGDIRGRLGEIVGQLKNRS